MNTDFETRVLARTHQKMMTHLRKSMKDSRRREQMRVKIAMRNIAEWRKEAIKEIEDETK